VRDLATATATANRHPLVDDKRARERKELRDGAASFLSSWVDAQNRGDAAGYFALYEPTHFKGVKRTRAGASTFDFAGWKIDRSKMMASHPKVEAQLIGFDSWLEPSSKLKRGAVEIHVTQRWQSAHYADHGEKVLSLWRDPKGALRIVYEDLLNSEPGWGAPPATGTLTLSAPGDVAGARALWKTIAPTGADYAAKLASIPDDPGVRRPLARVLLSDGNFECKEVEEFAECGEDHVEWKALDPAATVEDPCLRRKLALWALTPGILTEADVELLTPPLRALFALPAPEDELPKAAMALVGTMSDRVRARLFDAAMENSRKELAEASCCGGLSNAWIGTLYSRHHLDAAAAALDVATQRALVLEAAQDDKLSVETRRALVAHLGDVAGKDVMATLRAVADGAGDCALAVDAAVALAGRGDQSRLPRRHAGDGESAMARALCMLAHDGDAARRGARFAEFLPPRGRVKVSHEINSEWAERDDEGNKIDQSPKPTYLTRASATPSDLPDEYGAGPVPECGADGCSVPSSDGRWEIHFAAGKDGTLYIREIKRYEEHYCPC
jgi:hypothetical protein